MIELHQDALSGEGMASEFSLAFHRGAQGFAGLRETWRQIENSLSGKRFFHLYFWYRAYLDHLEQDPDSVIFCVMSRGSSPVAVFPLKIATQKVCGVSVRVLQIPTHDHIDLSDFIFSKTSENATLLKVLVRQLRQVPGIKWDMLYIPGALEDSTAAYALQLAPPPLWRSTLVYKSNYVNCATSYGEVAAGFDGRFRRNVRRLSRRAREMGKIQFHSYRSVEDINRHFQEILDVEAAGWKGESGTNTAIACDEKAGRFYKSLVEGFGPSGQCMLNLMLLNDKCIAGQLCLLVDGTVYILKIGFDEAYAAIAPGNLIMEQLFLQCAEDKTINTISFVTGKDWNYLWGAKSLQVYDHQVFNCGTVRGWIGYLLCRTKDLARSLSIYSGLKRESPAIT
ncbi:MAG: GNAT family N-acetyltransferase [Sulfuricaulis sp.]|uniref:GNAT family N-acetyltransferase n=1 Tax=Sulfuricaulis sp. TaxID=2003553 RepID=UPI0025D3C150|nr:GNAT family N-acetyltransferase [Sulfuricaulis sp.]MCR4347128.1 GNAT family N-acetyltransferase [Sulfuricaulis sp.]